MPMSNPTDQTFITNEDQRTLRGRFRALIRDTRAFDVLVGYFYTSGFHAICDSLEAAEKIRILIGIAAGGDTGGMIARARQRELPLSHAEAKDAFADKVIAEMEDADDSRAVADGVAKFIGWLRSGKLEIKAYPGQRLHAKLYIMSFAPGDRDAGRVITGSSNFTEAGLEDNFEFNVELKGRADYEFANSNIKPRLCSTRSGFSMRMAGCFARREHRRHCSLFPPHRGQRAHFGNARRQQVNQKIDFLFSGKAADGKADG